MIGFGYDSHRFGGEKTLKLGGIVIESELHVSAFSDGDTLIHALVDALLGASGKGDIGEKYPDTKSENENKDSSLFLKETISELVQDGFKIVNMDVTILLEQPKLSNYKNKIRENLALLCGIENKKINIKAKTNEKMGFTGRSEGVAVFCVCQLEKIKEL